MQQQQQQQQQQTDGVEGGGGDEENLLFPATGFYSVYDRVTLVKGFPHEVAHVLIDDDGHEGGDKKGDKKGDNDGDNDGDDDDKKKAAPTIKRASVLTWDFDVIKGDVSFVVYFAPKQNKMEAGKGTIIPRRENASEDDEEEDTAALGCGSIIGSYGEMMLENRNVGSPGEGSKQIMSKLRRGSLGGGVGGGGGGGGGDDSNAGCGAGSGAVLAGYVGVATEWRRLEDTARIYRERDSIQGSLEVTEPGCYVLQWENYEKQKTPLGPFEFPALAAAAKAKVMTFTELIPASKEIEGSISSFSLTKLTV